MTLPGVPTGRMKEEWDERARDDVFRYVDDRARTDEEFEALGVRDADLLLADVGAYLKPDQEAAVEIGCGPGRLLKPLAGRFREIWGTDVSREMVEQARPRVATLDNVRLLETGGERLDGVPSEYFEFCYSAFVFECIPDRAVIGRNLEEAYRVLKPGGFLKFNAAGVFARNPFRPFYETVRSTWSGARFTMSELAKLTEDIGFEVLWCYHARDVTPAYRDADLEVEYRIWVVARKGNAMDEWESVCQKAGQGLMEAVPSDATVIMVDPGWSAQVQAASSPDLRFLSFYTPADSEEAMATLDGLRGQGGQYLLLTRYARWWEESYPGLFTHLETRYRTIKRTDEYLLVDLTTGPCDAPR